MKAARGSTLSSIGGITFPAGAAMATSFVILATLPTLKGPQVISFFAYFTIAGLAYGLSVLRLPHNPPPMWMIWSFAVVFRVCLLFTDPSLSSDVFRYVWDGHLLNQGINPYALPVNSPALDSFQIPVRALVDHDWMASPYLPAAQLFFALVTRIAPGSPLAFQIVAVVFDLATGLLVMDLLALVNLPRQGVLVYLWNPLVILEAAHGAHIDTLMVCLLVAALWLLIRGRKNLSVIALAASTLIKGIPLLLVTVLLRRWGWRRLLLYAGLVFAGLAIFAAGAGWGMTGPLGGRGVFGAIRIYLSYWNFNSGLYHWLEVWLTGYPTPGAVPVELVDPNRIQLARFISVGVLLAALGVGLWLAWRADTRAEEEIESRNHTLLQLAIIPGAAYLLTTTTVHPWYLTLIIPFLPFLISQRGRVFRFKPVIWSWLYFSVAVAFSYLTYIDPQNLREFGWVRLVEYLPFYGLLVWGLLRTGANAIPSHKLIHFPKTD